MHGKISMKALSKTAVSLAISTIAAQTAQPLHGLQTRDTNSPAPSSELDQLAVQFRDRLAQLDALISRSRTQLERVDNLPTDLREQLEARSNEIRF